MTDEYRRPYTIIFNAVTDALAALDKGEYARAKALLIQAQQEAEEAYISGNADDA